MRKRQRLDSAAAPCSPRASSSASPSSASCSRASIVVSVTNGGSEAPLALVGKDFADTAEYLGLAVFAAFLVIFSNVVLSGKR